MAIKPREPQSTSLLTLQAATATYLDWLQVSRDLSPHTYRAYRGDLLVFAGFVGNAARLAEIDRERVTDFIRHERERGLAVTSIRRRVASVRGMFKWLGREGHPIADPCQNLVLEGERSRRLPRVVADPDLDLLLRELVCAAGLSQLPSRRLNGRVHRATNLVAVIVMVATGIRVGELTALRCADVDAATGRLKILGKGRRERVVYLPNEWSRELLASYLQLRATLRPPHDALFFNRSGEPLSTAAFRSRLRTAAASCGLENGVTPHMLRHTAATQLIDAGVDIRVVQRLLGHASISTTELYTHVADPTLRRIVAEADVLGRLATGG